MNCERIHTEEREGFDIAFYACEEDESPRGQFQNEDGSDDEELLAKIADGTYAWFCTKVTASKAGVELGVDWLGECCYESAAAFVREEGYYPDMVARAIADARQTLADMNAIP